MYTERHARLAETHALLWRYHDEQEWKKLRETLVIHIIALGHPAGTAKKAAGHVLRTFQLADRAWESQQANKPKLEARYYRLIEQEFIKAHLLLGAETASVPFKVKWIRASRHRNKPLVLANLFLEHLFKLGFNLRAVKAFVVAFSKVYPAHSAHNWPELKKAFERYWRAINASDSAPWPPQF